MKAFLLAAGLGTRLRPLTDAVPKCLLPIGGQPLLGIWLDALAKAGVDEVLVNTHHLPGAVESYLAERSGGPAVETFYEEALLGSAGTLVANASWASDEDCFLVCYADNLTDADLGALVQAHREAPCDATLGLFHTDRPSACGIVETDASGLVTAFVEKPEHPRSNLANAGISVLTPGAIAAVPEGPPPLDIGFHLLPRLLGRSRGVLLDGYLRDIGTVESYGLAQIEWGARVKR